MIEQLGRYEILEQIGQGGFAIVYRGRDIELDRWVALKELRATLLADPDWVKQFKREARTIARLDHRRIVTIFDIMEVGQRLFIIMRLVEGLSLDHLLARQGRLPWLQMVEIITAVAEGLDYAHAQNILHRDLKPANILLDSKRGPLLSDFGLAKLAGETSTQMSASGTVVGTPHYIAPEVWEGQGSSRQSDIYALGCIVYEMLTGEKLFQGTSPPAVMLAHFSPPQLPERWPEGVPARVAEVLKIALAQQPNKRYSSAGELVAALARLSEEKLPSSFIPPDAPRRVEPFVPTSPLSTPLPHNLPVQSTPFVGRTEELAQIAAHLADPACRLLSLVGPGGIGKTRLAIQAARCLVEAASSQTLFRHGVYFVSLVSLSSTEHLVPTIADALHFTFYSDIAPKQQLLDYLREKAIVLVLDNFEHLLEGAELLTDLLAVAPALKILVTSREGLNLQEEWLYPLQGLQLPVRDKDETESALKEYSAVKLFVQSALRVRPGFALAAEAEAVIHICHLVEGIPLGIELAAAWAKLLPCSKIAVEIEANLDFLSSSLRNIPARHRSMRAVFEQSWQRLSETEQVVLRQLSVFRGGFRRKAAEQVVGASLAILAGLVDKSLVSLTPAGRYYIHELLRQFAVDKLYETPAEQQTTHERHSAYFLGFLREREIGLRGKQQKAILDEIQAEVENVWAAWNWVVAQGQVEALNLAVDNLHYAIDSLYYFYWIRCRFQEGEEAFRSVAEYLQQVLQLDRPAPEQAPLEKVLMKALARQGVFCAQLGGYGIAKELLQKSLDLAHHWAAQVEIAFCLNFLGDILRAQGAFGEAKQHYQESLIINQQLGDPMEIAYSFNRLGWVAHLFGDYLGAKQYFQESLRLYREIGYRYGMAHALDKLGNETFMLGEYVETAQHYQESLAIFKEIGDQLGIAKALGGLGFAAWLGDNKLAEAKAYLEESLTVCRQTGQRLDIATRLFILGMIVNDLGLYEISRQYCSEALAIAQELGIPDETALSLAGLGEAACGLGDFQATRKHLCEALDIARNIHVLPTSLRILDIWANLLVREGEVRAASGSSRPGIKEQALELVTFILHHPASMQLSKNKAARLIAELEAELPPEVVVVAQEQGKTRNLEEVIAEILESEG